MSRTQSVVREFRDVIVSRPFAEPLLAWRRSFLGVATTGVTHQSSFDDFVEELFALLAEEAFGIHRSR